jgi:hypothetical protein
MKNILDKIDEKVVKPSFEEFFLNKKNKRMIEKVWIKNYDDAVNEIGMEWLEDDRYDCEDMDPDECYENYSHAAGGQAEYDASFQTIYHFKSKYDYKHKDENDEDKQYKLAEFLGYEP